MLATQKTSTAKSALRAPAKGNYLLGAQDDYNHTDFAEKEMKVEEPVTLCIAAECVIVDQLAIVLCCDCDLPPKTVPK